MINAYCDIAAAPWLVAWTKPLLECLLGGIITLQTMFDTKRARCLITEVQMHLDKLVTDLARDLPARLADDGAPIFHAAIPRVAARSETVPWPRQRK